MPTLWPRRPTPTQRTRGSVTASACAGGKAPSVNTWISARGSSPTSARAVRTASGSRSGRSRARAAASAASARARSRPSAAATRGWTPASITITSAPSPRRRTSWVACPRATSKRDGETSRARIEAEVSSTTTTLRAPSPMTVATGRASATESASSARIWRIRSGSRCSRWKNAEASRSRRAGAHSSRLDTVCWRRRTFRKYRRTSGRASAKSASASGERRLIRAPGPGAPRARTRPAACP